MDPRVQGHGPSSTVNCTVDVDAITTPPSLMKLVASTRREGSSKSDDGQNDGKNQMYPITFPKEDLVQPFDINRFIKDLLETGSIDAKAFNGPKPPAFYDVNAIDSGIDNARTICCHISSMLELARAQMVYLFHTWWPRCFYPPYAYDNSPAHGDVLLRMALSTNWLTLDSSPYQFLSNQLHRSTDINEMDISVLITALRTVIFGFYNLRQVQAYSPQHLQILEALRMIATPRNVKAHMPTDEMSWETFNQLRQEILSACYFLQIEPTAAYNSCYGASRLKVCRAQQLDSNLSD